MLCRTYMGSREEPVHGDPMPTPTSAQRGSFKKCQGALSLLAPIARSIGLHGVIAVTGQAWVCTICPATGDRGQAFFPNFKAALNHERTAHDREPSTEKTDKDINEADGTRIPANHADETWDGIGQPRLTSEGLRQWEMHAHVDHVFDLVPFWQRGMDAAEKGEVLRLEEFLEKMEGDGGWRTANDVLGMLGEWKASPSERARNYGGLMWGHPTRDDWAAGRGGAWEPNAHGWADGWGAASNRIASDATESSRGRDSGWGIREEWAEGTETGRSKADAVRDGWGAGARVKMVRGAGGGARGREELHHFVDAIAQQEAVNEERRKQMHLFFEASFC